MLQHALLAIACAAIITDLPSYQRLKDFLAEAVHTKPQHHMTQILGVSLDSHDIYEGFLKSWGLILCSEIGDKTFFIAAIMAMKHSRLVVFAGALGALAGMTALSAVMGWAAPNLISKTLTHYAAIALFLFFGLRSLHDAFAAGSEEGGGELEEVEKELTAQKSKPSVVSAKGRDRPASPGGLISPVFLQAFTLTFLAEWGDRSQVATIGLAASVDVVGVTLGGILGHALCTGAAVLGGRKMATLVNEKVVGIVGGVMFILFALHAFWSGVDEQIH